MIKSSKKNVKGSKPNKRSARRAPLRLYAYFHENHKTGTTEQFVTLARSWNEAVEKMAKLCERGDWGLHRVEEYR